MIKFILAILLIVGALVIAIGDWAMIDSIFDWDYMPKSKHETIHAYT